MHTDIELTCAKCGKPFWWTAGEQQYYAERRFAAPKRCAACRKNGSGSRAAVPARIAKQAELDEVSVRSIAVPSPLVVIGDGESMFDDIRKELEKVKAPIVERRRTLWELIRGVDIVEQQRQAKSRATENALHMMRDRIAVIETAGRLTTIAGQTQLASSRAIVEQLEVDNRGMELLNALQHKRVIGPLQLETECLEEEAKQNRLNAQLRESNRDEEERVLGRQRRIRNAEVRARQTKLDDFLRQIEEICESRKPVSEKALRIREIQSVFEMDEDALPAEARAVLAKAEAETADA
jgi:hypothetical protein